MATIYSTRLGLPSPDGNETVNSGPAELQAINNGIDAIYGQEFADVLQPGVVGTATLANASGPTINSSTGVVTVTLRADTAWVDVAGTLTRCLLPTSPVNITPSSLPSSGNFICLGVFVAPAGYWSTTGALSGAVSASQPSAFRALTNPPATPTGTLLLEYVIITNTSGTYSIVSANDERAYASRAVVSSTAGVRIVAGNVTSAGAVATGTNDWIVARNSTGNYTVTYATAYTSWASAVANPSSSGTAVLPYMSLIGLGSFTVAFFNLADIATDTTFSFISVGQ